MPAPDPVALHSPTEVAAIVLTSWAWVERVRLPEYDTLTFCTLKTNYKITSFKYSLKTFWQHYNEICIF